MDSTGPRNFRTMSETSREDDVPQTIFGANHKPFPDPIDGKICTAQFLEASSSVVVLLEQLGKVFAPVRYDMNGNIQKIRSRYIEDTSKFEFLNDMLLLERAEGGARTADALLWLRRALHFLHSFLMSICENTKEEKRNEDLSENIQKAYKETLEMYHGWMAQRLFGVLSKMIPNRSQLLRTLALNHEVSEEIIFRELARFLSNMNSNLVLLSKFYADEKLDPGTKCS